MVVVAGARDGSEIRLQVAESRRTPITLQRTLPTPYASPVAQMVKNPPAMWETRVGSLGWGDPLEKQWQPTPVFLPGESHGQRRLVGYSPSGCKDVDTTELRLSTQHAQATHSHTHTPYNAIPS